MSEDTLAAIETMIAHEPLIPADYPVIIKTLRQTIDGSGLSAADRLALHDQVRRREAELHARRAS